MASSSESSKKHTPRTGMQTVEETFTFNFISDDETREYIQSHGRVMFIIRGPSGSFKNTLSSLLLQHYPSAVKCSADSYFDMVFSSRVRDKTVTKASHQFCENRVIEECEKGTHPIIVQNTHIKKWEMKPYLDFAAKYGYTVIMAITIRKLKTTAEDLQKSNRHGLPKEYLQLRLKQWQEYIPDFLGWFLGPDDSSFLLNQGKKAISALIGDGKFCSAFNAYCEEDILQYFKVKDNLFCVLQYWGYEQKKKNFYLSDDVQNEYGKSTLLSIQGFVITKTSLLAVVNLASKSKDLFLKSKQLFEDSNDDLCSAFECIKVREGFAEAQCNSLATTFKKDLVSGGKTVSEADWSSDEEVNVCDLSIIMLGQNNTQSTPIKDVDKFIKMIFSDVADSKGHISLSEFSEFDDGVRYIRLPNDTWFVLSATKIEVGAVFTGLYS